MSKKRLKYVYDDDDFYEDYYDYEEYEDYQPKSSIAPTKKLPKVKTVPATKAKNKNSQSEVKKSQCSQVKSAASKLQQLSLDEKILLEKAKPILNYIVVGHVDAGKSTLLGHLLFDLGYFQKSEIDHLQQEIAVGQKSKTNAFSWLLDLDEEERSRGVTIDLCYKFIETEKAKINLIDAPGHRDFIPNLIQGVSHSEAAILVIPASNGQFESSFKFNGQTREHALLLKYLGVKKLIVAVNKMDAVDFSQDRFNEIKNIITAFFNKTVHFENSVEIHFVPTSGLNGENLTKKSTKPELSWYSGSSLLDYMQECSPQKNQLVDKPLRIIVSDVKKGPKVFGNVASGFVKPAMGLQIYPQNETCKIKSILKNELSASMASAGESVELNLSNVDEAALSKGCVLGMKGQEINVSTTFKAAIVTLDAMEDPMIQGSGYTLYIHTLSTTCSISRMLSCRPYHSESGEVKTSKLPRLIEKNFTAIVEVVLDRPLCLEKFSEVPSMGRFVMRSSGETVAAGVVI